MRYFQAMKGMLFSMVFVGQICSCYGMNTSRSKSQTLFRSGLQGIEQQLRPSSAPVQRSFTEGELSVLEQVATTVMCYEQQIKSELKDSDRYIDIVSQNRDVANFAILCYANPQDIRAMYDKVAEFVPEVVDVNHLLKVLDLAAFKITQDVLDELH